MGKSYPIIVAHNGAQEYLDICLKQARHSNPNSRIILIGNNNKKENLLPFVEYYDAQNYMQSANEFNKIYQHHSSNPVDYERFCFERWFIINDFIKEQNIDSFLHIDSDVLLYTDFSKEDEYMNIISQYEMTISYASCHTSFFTSQDALEHLCNFIFGLFNDKRFLWQFNKISKLIKPETKTISHYKSKDDYPNNVLSDMTALFFYKNIYNNIILDTLQPIHDSAINMNLHIRQGHGFKCSAIGKLINVIFDNQNQPHYFDLNKNKLIKLHNIHFQGERKCLMENYATFNKNKQIVAVLADEVSFATYLKQI